MRQWPKSVRWGLAIVLTFVVSGLLAFYADALPFGQSLGGSVLRGVVAGVTFVLMMRWLALGPRGQGSGSDE
ncbi:hypothetical protein [Maritimibacter sp. UBA3975]|uniref:hypothetical protein n=1 Tax=Maritimibacter sp. UBA3975 TaxID=1946833 RepID=UPI000C09C18D|nr:hypothetical protein [Maritimibacter sp. UBA3975]MAM63979.1 hypothetical protein [Maritimibacter sp.]|tara:strand:+ start:2553 stop:2768 length:216 start_codon:yes stop_codon:yes gene_type:complete